MQTTVSCPGWDYKTVPGYDHLLTSRARAAIAQMRRQGDPSARLARMKDTRPFHGALFQGLTPPGHEYYSGHYRGDDSFFCLAHYEVCIPVNPLVGYPAQNVADAMEYFKTEIDTYAQECDALWPVNEMVFSASEKLVRTVYVAVALFSYFLQIHPYADGNGHTARMLLLLALGRYEIWPKTWPIHPSPGDSYSLAIYEYQHGRFDALVKFVLSYI